ncbi:MAG: hypothetical protein JW720_00495 [Sedimentisphaerales bacterium]|nr:hypothetical protein [Sedimentisphaerales bacterium]
MAKKAVKTKRAKWINTAVTMLINAAVWSVPSNVAYLTAQNRDILLGRYSLGHFTAALLLIPISAASLYMTWANEKNVKERKFKVLAVVISIIFSLIVIDTGARLMFKPRRYVAAQTYTHRPPNTVQKGTAEDVPEEAFLYPRTPQGYPDIEYTLTVDKRGFRNTTDLDRYDIVVLGDSFAEGSRVSNDDAWPVMLGQKTGLAVYNLGMSAGHPCTYFETLKRFGSELAPKTVICMLYEGNDFRSSNYEEKDTLPKQIEDYFRRSPVRNALKDALIRSFGSTPSGAPAGQGDSPATADRTGPLSWLPVALPAGENAHYYTFKVKRLLEHFVTMEEFLKEEGTKETFAALRRIKGYCSAKGIRLIIAYAPDKPHLLMPLISETVPPEQVRAFMALKEGDLPGADKLYEALLQRIEVQESAVRDFCRDESIEFISLTEPLRKATAEAAQTYFTYDQHWTPPGHNLVADALAAAVREDADAKTQ